MGFVTVKEAAERYAVTTDTMRNWAKSGKVKSAGEGQAMTISDEGMPELKTNATSNENDAAGNKGDKSGASVDSKTAQLIEEQKQTEANVAIQKANQELEAIKAGFKTVDDFNKAINDAMAEKQKYLDGNANLVAKQALLNTKELEQKATDDKLKENANVTLTRIAEKEQAYTKKWEKEDAERKAKNQGLIAMADELARQIFNLSSDYMAEIAKDRIEPCLVDLCNAIGLNLVFRENGEYVPIIYRDDTPDFDKLAKRPVNQAYVAPDNIQEQDEQVDRAKSAIKICTDIYKLIIDKQGCYDTAVWLYGVLKVVTVWTGKEISDNMKQLLDTMKTVNTETIKLAQKTDISDKPNVSLDVLFGKDKHEDNSLCQKLAELSDKLESTLGIVSS